MIGNFLLDVFGIDNKKRKLKLTKIHENIGGLQYLVVFVFIFPTSRLQCVIHFDLHTNKNN